MITDSLNRIGELCREAIAEREARGEDATEFFRILQVAAGAQAELPVIYSMEAVTRQREQVAQAFFAKYGIEPNEAQQVWVCEGNAVRWWIERRTPDTPMR